MGVSPSKASSHTKSNSCPEQNASEGASESGAESKFIELAEDKHQFTSEPAQIEPGGTSITLSSSDALRIFSEDVTKGSLAASLDRPSEDASKSRLKDQSPIPKHTATDQKLESVLEDSHSELGIASPHNGQSKEKNSLGSGIVQNDNVPLTFTFNATLQPLPQDATKSFLTNNLELHRDDATRSNEIRESSISQEIVCVQTPKFLSDGAWGEPSALPETPSDAVDESWNCKQSKTPSKDAVSNSVWVGCSVKTAAKSREKYMLKSLRRSDRVMRSRSQENPKAHGSSANQPNVSSNIETTKKNKKNRQGKKIEADEYSRIRMRLRYFLHRISYEQSLITAYSAEGWKGLSLEKLKPEKELQRATSEIFRRKSKIRDLFQHIDSMCAEGRLPKSLFDSEGQISSEDIFCAKCGSKDLTADNDIILCDGACDRGFHQFCLVPPLLKEDIPPDDEAWLCPGCECKVYCINLVNESQGTNITISDSWEKIFPEAAAAGQNSDQNFGLPSDDSNDDDYDPECPEIEKSQGDESSSDDSDDSDFTPDELEATTGDKQWLELSSEDSEDDDFDPDASDHDGNAKEESSSSDFTSDSEDLAAILSDNELSGENKRHMPIEAQGEAIKEGSKQKQSIDSELLSLAESKPSQDGSALISGRRNVERLDYKKLYDETYANVLSGSSDDEDYTGAVGPMKRRKSTEAALTTENGSAPVINTRKQDLKKTEYSPQRNSGDFNSESTSILPDKGHEGSSPSSSCGGKVRPSVYKRLGEAATQGLYESFKENQYPDRARKENLAKELGITFRQVTKWFDNARWSFNHSSSKDASAVSETSRSNILVPETETNQLESGHKTVIGDGTCTRALSAESLDNDDALVDIYVQDARETVFGIQSSAQKSKTPKSRKRKHQLR